MSKPTTKTLVPKLRFPEFHDAGEWSEKQLCYIGEVLQGYGFPEAIQGKLQGEYPFYKVSDISTALKHGNHFIEISANYIDKEELTSLKAKTIPSGTTIFAKIGEAIRLNRRAITTCESLIDNNIAGVKAITGKSNDQYIFYTLTLINLIEYSGGAVPSVNKTTLQSIPIYLPPEEMEQQKIADCLSSIDELIAAQTKKHDALKAYKKGLMQQLFPAEGETLPKLRFPEFHDAGEWNITTIVGIGSISSGGTPSRTKKDFWNGKIPWVTTTLIDFNTIIAANEHITEDGLQHSSAKILPKGTILMAMYGQGKTRGKVAILGLEAAINQACAAITLKKGINTAFVFQNLVSRYDEIRRISNQGGQENLSATLIKNIPFAYPDIKTQEQQKIADCLSSIDELITAQAQKIESLKAHKKRPDATALPFL